jgi:uncharacterized NAD(P)/FAD-binding protein YdhS
MMRRTTAVIGGGASGALVVLQLLRCTDDEVLLIEPGTPGAGVAYGAARPWHLLNSRAGAMSADPENPRHFVTWLRGRGIEADTDAFVSRRHFGRYLYASLDAAACADPGRVRLFDTRVARLRPDADGHELQLEDGRALRAERTVLTVGGPAGRHPAGVGAAARAHAAYVGDPWASRALDGIAPSAPVLLLGTGLTAVDVAVSLARGGHAGPISAVSRRGLLPRAHTATPAGASAPFPYEARLRPLVRQLRVAAARGDWRLVVDGLRPHLDAIWAGLDDGERDRFLRHLARHWEVHRHRMAPGVAAEVQGLCDGGTLTVAAARVARVEPAGAGLEVTFADGASQRFGAVVNCTGPGGLPESASPLLTTLLADGLVRPGPHGLGLDADPAGRLRDARGGAHPALWTVGPLRRGRLWETTAVPEIRAQAVAFAEAAGAAAVSARPAAAPRDRLAA